MNVPKPNNRTNRYMNIHTTIERITPDLAEKYLEANTANRTLRQNHVYKLASDIKGGRWHLNGSSIVFNGDGTLLDGQHRLAAIVHAGEPVDVLVVRGVSKAAMPSIDANISRKASDVAHLAGFINTNVVTGAARILLNVRDNVIARSDWASTGTIMEFLRLHPHLQDSVNTCYRLHKIMPSTTLSAWHYLAFYVCGFEEECTRAMSVLETGIPAYANDPIHAFRERAIKDKKSLVGGISARMRTLWTITNVWNEFLEGETRLLCRIQQTPVKMTGLDIKKL